MDESETEIDLAMQDLVGRPCDPEARERLHRYMEDLLTAVGKADKVHEIAQMRANALAGLGSQLGPQAASQATAAQLEDRRTELALYRELHRVIELGRAFAERAEPEAPKPPSQLD